MTAIIPYGRQHIDQSDIDAVVATLQSDFLTQGPKVAEFEKKFAQYVGSKFAVAIANGTGALHLSAIALGIKPGVNVITTPITFSASANCVRYCGGNVYFADIDPDTFLIDLEKVRTLIESKPKGFFSGIIPVDFAGYPVNMEAFRSLANQYSLWILEDACHAPGGYFIDSKGIKQNCGNGNFADLAVFSFHPVKHIACGEGGMITTNNESLYRHLLKLRTHGITRDPNEMHENHGGWYMEMQELGFNYRMPDVLCALGISQLAKADHGLERRIAIAKKYDAELKKNPTIQLPKWPLGHAFHLYIIQHPDRTGLYNFLRSKNIYTQVHYVPVHWMPYYQSLGNQKGDFPAAENYYAHCLSLPIYSSLTERELDYVISCINSYSI